MKKLYLITRVLPNDWEYDEYLGFVIAAVSRRRAFVLMEKHKAGVEWTAEYLGISNRMKEGIILRSFQSG